MNLTFSEDENGIRILPSKLAASNDAEYLALGILAAMDDIDEDTFESLIERGKLVTFERVQ